MVSQSRYCLRGFLVKWYPFPKSQMEKEVITVENNQQHAWLLVPGFLPLHHCIS